MLDVFITSRVRRKIVVVYAKYPDFHTHVRGLAKLIKEDPGNIQRELKRLEKVGFLQSEKQGNSRTYFTNKQFPIFKELQSMVIKCKYNVDSNGQYHIVFTPFAIIRSMEKEELKKVFRVLITDESEYRNKL